jgi:hypothetical protein
MHVAAIGNSISSYQGGSLWKTKLSHSNYARSVMRNSFIFWCGNLHGPMFPEELRAILPGRET